MDHAPITADAPFASEALLSRLRALTQEIAGVRQARDPECLHRMRVAARRLHHTLGLFEVFLPPKKLVTWQKQMRRLLRALGPARDTDVQLAFLEQILVRLHKSTVDEAVQRQPGIERVRLRLQQRRAKLQDKVNAALDKWEASEVTLAMEHKLAQLAMDAEKASEAAGSCLREQAGAESLRCLHELLAYESSVFQPEQVEALHAMRIAAKHLRYALEVYAPLLGDDVKLPLKFVRKLQDILGDLHDCDVWTIWLPTFMAKERVRTQRYFGHTRSFARLMLGLTYVRDERARHRTRRYQEFLELWQEIQARNVWSGLAETLQRSVGLQEREN